MSDDERTGRDFPCIEFVDLVTSYLDHALPAELHAIVDEHLDTCDGCRTALAQWRTVIDLAGRLTEVDIAGVDPLTRDRLTTTFRALRRR